MKNLAELFAALRQPNQEREALRTAIESCLQCSADLRESETYQQARVCHACRFHFTISARDRIGLLADAGTFRESNRAMISIDPIAFAREYKRRLFDEERRTGLADAIVTGSAVLNGHAVSLAVVDFRFLGGTIGSVVGEKLTRAMETAARRRRPLVAVVASGGARMQEGPLALLQTAKIALARRRMAEARAPFLCVLSTPSFGAAYTSIGSLADYLIAEPGALIGYAAARTSNREQGLTAEALLQRGLLDEVVDRSQVRELLGNVLDVLTARTRVTPEGGALPDQPAHIHGQAWNRVQTARHEQRPSALDYIGRIAATYVELRGDRLGTDAASVTCGLASIAGETVVIVGQQRPGGTADPKRDVWLGPDAFRKAARAFRFAGRFGLPVISLIDTPGADPRPEASAGGLGPAMADCAAALAEVSVPTIAVVIGEGGSEAAVAFGIADRVLMLEHAIYTVMSPERAALLLHRDASRADEVADALHLTADACRELNVIDSVVPEPEGGAHIDHDAASRHLRTALLRALAELGQQPAKKLMRARYRRYRDIGEYSSYIGTTLAHEVYELRTAIKNKSFAAAARLRHPRRKVSDSSESLEGLIVP
ncbi:MAG: acetyl-CoA carboxylase carboxyl transferase subunit beta [Chloroflexi bacterium]|nr:acetyl-CoA carboxylase carboxyl transferase subunit beta [Chloroflexota bacterium]